MDAAGECVYGGGEYCYYYNKKHNNNRYEIYELNKLKDLFGPLMKNSYSFSLIYFHSHFRNIYFKVDGKDTALTAQ